jgi:hypothetical protein
VTGNYIRRLSRFDLLHLTEPTTDALREGSPADPDETATLESRFQAQWHPSGRTNCHQIVIACVLLLLLLNLRLEICCCLGVGLSVSNGQVDVVFRVQLAAPRYSSSVVTLAGAVARSQ